MNTATTILRMLFTGRVQRAPQDMDPADMGTCFGLEMTFEAEPPCPPAVNAAPSSREPAWRPLPTGKPASA